MPIQNSSPKVTFLKHLGHIRLCIKKKKKHSQVQNTKFTQKSISYDSEVVKKKKEKKKEQYQAIVSPMYTLKNAPLYKD